MIGEDQIPDNEGPVCCFEELILYFILQDREHLSILGETGGNEQLGCGARDGKWAV